MIDVIIKQTKNPRGRPVSFDREEVLRQATLTFWRSGYEGASIADLTAAMGITPQSLYAAFGSKSALYREALAHYQRTLGNYASRTLAAPGPVVPSIAGMLRQAAREFSKPGRPRGCMVSKAMLCYAQENHAEHAHTAQLREAAIGEITLRLDQALQAGELKPGTDTTALARYLGCMIQGMSIQAEDGASKRELVAVAEVAIASLEAMAERASSE